MAWWMPVLQAIGLNAGKNLLTGQDPLQGAGQAALLSQFGGFGGTEIPGAEVATSASDVSSIIPGSIESELGAVNPVTGTYLAQDQYANFFGQPIFKGGQGLLSNLGDEASAALSNINPENLTGLASLLEQQPDTSAYRQSAGTGGVSRGQLGQSQPLSNVAVNRRKMNIWA